MATKAKKATAKKSKTAKKTSASGLPIKSVTAVANLMPPGPFSLHVRARISVPTPGYRAHLEPAVPPGINQNILILLVVLQKLPGIWPQHVTDIDALYDDGHYTHHYKEVTVRYGSKSKSVKVQIVV